MKFLGYETKDYVAKALQDLEFNDFSNIQKEVFDNLNSGKNIIARSKTGSGKTHAYLLPVFNELDPKDETCQAVIVTPTIELARQVYKVALHIASFSGDTINVKAYFGGTDLQKEVAKIKAHMPQVVIATPGKLEDLVIKQNVLKIHEAKYCIIDEADMVADSFLDELLNLANSLANARKMVFSATFREEILVILKKYLTNTQILEIKEEGNSNNLDIKHYLIPTKTRDRKDLLLELTSIINPYLAIIFANKGTEVDEIYQLLKEKNYNVCYLHGNLDVRSRKRIINENLIL